MTAMGRELTVCVFLAGFAPPDAVLGHRPLHWPVELLDYPRCVMDVAEARGTFRANNTSNVGLWPDKLVHADPPSQTPEANLMLQL